MERKAVVLQVGRDTYRVIYHPRSDLNAQVINTLTSRKEERRGKAEALPPPISPYGEGVIFEKYTSLASIAWLRPASSKNAANELPNVSSPS
jgi:hypothetical protein